MKRSLSLRGGSEFQRVWDKGKSWSHPLLIIRVSANGASANRFGFVVGKKVGKAVERNRIKRLMREAVRHHLESASQGWDVILIARHQAENADFGAIDGAVESLLKKAHLLEN